MLSNLKENAQTTSDLKTRQAPQISIAKSPKSTIVPIKAGFTQFEVINAIYDSKILSEVKLTAGARLVLISLARHYNPSNDEFFPSYSCIASHTGVSKKSVERAIKELVGAGLITYRTEKVNRYRFTGRFFASVNLSVDPRQNDGCDQRQNVAQTNNHEKRINNGKNIKNSFCDGAVKNLEQCDVQRPNGENVLDLNCRKNSTNFSWVKNSAVNLNSSQNGASRGVWGDNASARAREARYILPPNERKGGSSFTPSVSSTSEYLKAVREAREAACSPLDFDFERAKRWYDSLSAPLRSTALARKVVAKYPQLLE